MTIISVQNLLEKCHNKMFLRYIAFSRPLSDEDVKFFFFFVAAFAGTK